MTLTIVSSTVRTTTERTTSRYVCELTASNGKDYEVHSACGSLPWELATLAKTKHGRAWRWHKDLTKGLAAEVLALAQEAIRVHREIVMRAQTRDYLLRLQAHAATRVRMAQNAVATLAAEPKWTNLEEVRAVALSNQEKARNIWRKSADVRGLFDTPEVFEQPDPTPAPSAVDIVASLREQAATRCFRMEDDADYFIQSYVWDASADSIFRQLVERAVIRKAVTDLIASGCDIRVHDGEDFNMSESRDLRTIMCNIMTTDYDSLIVYGPNRPTVGRRIDLIYGNDGYDVISDYVVSLDSFLRGANDLGEAISEYL